MNSEQLQAELSVLLETLDGIDLTRQDRDSLVKTIRRIMPIVRLPVEYYALQR